MFEESFSEAWRLRYGAAPPIDTPAIDRLLLHRSVRKFSERQIEEDTVRGLVAAAQSAATSSNLQLYSIISVQDPERREAMAKLCADYQQVRTAPWFFAFLADHHRLKRAAAEVGEQALGMDYMEFLVMALIDVALAAERMSCAAESLGLGICYIGAMRNDVKGVQELLKLPRGVFGVFGLCIGWPAEGAGAEIKPRLSQDSIWFREQYPERIDVSDYDDRMREFYLSQGMKGEVTWTMRSGKRVDEHHLSGREVLLDWLREQGFGLR
ncbi:MAG TPA: nitroreductase family protein [Fimbriimonadaceae bacterium]|nr:nitroreductase family protein [Fimbriimonadaceae bacterium]